MEGETLVLSERASLSADDILSVVEAWENASSDDYNMENSSAAADRNESFFEFQKVMTSAADHGFQKSSEESPMTTTCKRQKLMMNNAAPEEEGLAHLHRNNISHITVERNRRKQMNHHLSVLRSLMPCFYVKRGDQASIIGGVVDYINELQQVLQSLEAKKQRKASSAYNNININEAAVAVLSPRLSLPISPRTPQRSPYKAAASWMQQQLPAVASISHSLPSPVSPCSSSATNSSSADAVNELVATTKSPLAEVEVKFSGPNLQLKTVSPRIPGQVLKIISALEELALEILQLTITTTLDQTMLYSFTIKKIVRFVLFLVA
ncbi:hypothetical protein C2S53_013080 [Perilla frutescens var. hirtella]|uniref:BHLH domain-containing protein n=1 Tax=Perilla frutescens var. hirtella TaxID=608512 RepID=A0AAD4J6X1_PERFH|nr:hypothetical protein C2S53_013080 [Perilla frutescens var. hirtella]